MKRLKNAVLGKGQENEAANNGAWHKRLCECTNSTHLHCLDGCNKFAAAVENALHVRQKHM